MRNVFVFIRSKIISQQGSWWEDFASLPCALALAITARDMIPKVVNIDPFHRNGHWGGFCRQAGPRCAAVRDTASDARAPLATKRARALSRGWGKSARPGAQGAFGWRLPAVRDAGVPHRAARRACPAGRFAPMKRVNINDLWYDSSVAPQPGVPLPAGPEPKLKKIGEFRSACFCRSV